MTFTLGEDHEPEPEEFDDIDWDIEGKELEALLDQMDEHLLQLQTTIRLVKQHGTIVAQRDFID